jgi:hypothetical protein
MDASTKGANRETDSKPLSLLVPVEIVLTHYPAFRSMVKSADALLN